MVLWVLTAGIGVYLLAAGLAAQRLRVPAAVPDVPAGVPDGEAAYGVIPERSPPAGALPQGESPLLEFTHPLLALTGLTFWIFFVMTGDRMFAWIAFGIVVLTVLAGLSWLASGRRARRREAESLRFPPHLIALHGLAATCTVALVVISAVTAAPH